MARGRPPGSRNRNTNAALQLLKKKLGKDFDPLVEMGVMYAKSEDEAIKAGLLKDMCGYIHPKLKAVEHSGDMTHKLMTVAEQIMAAEKDVHCNQD